MTIIKELKNASYVIAKDEDQDFLTVVDLVDTIAIVNRFDALVRTDALAEIDKIISNEILLNKTFDTDDWWTCDKLRIPFENHTTRMLNRVRDKLSK